MSEESQMIATGFALTWLAIGGTVLGVTGVFPVEFLQGLGIAFAVLGVVVIGLVGNYARNLPELVGDE